MDAKCLALALIDSFHDFGDGIKTVLTGGGDSEQHLVRMTRQYILNILHNKFKELFATKRYDRRERFNLHLRAYIKEHFEKDTYGHYYDKNIKESELFITKLFYAFVFEEKLYDSEYKLKGTESGKPYTYETYVNHERDQFKNGKINPIFSTNERESNWTSLPILPDKLESPYYVLNLGNNKEKTGLFGETNGNVQFYNWMKTLYNSSYIKYFQDANTSVPRELLCIQPDKLEPINQSYYIGTAKLYDPGTNIGKITESTSEKPTEIVKPIMSRPRPSKGGTPTDKPIFSKPQRTKPSQSSTQNPKDCKFVIPNLKYDLTKERGELILFDKIEFIDSSSISQYGTITVTIGSKIIGLKTEKISEESKGIEFFKRIIYEISKYQYTTSIQDRGNLDAAKRKTELNHLFEILNNETNKIIQDAYNITLDSRTDPRDLFQLSEDDYVRALFDFKRAGDFGQVAAVQAAITHYPSEVCPVFVSLDRIAILFAIYCGVPCMYRGDSKSNDILVKCFNFKQRHSKDSESESSKSVRCTPDIVNNKINEVWNNNFIKEINQDKKTELNKYKIPKCKAILNSGLDSKISSIEEFYITYTNRLHDRMNRYSQDILNYKAQGGFESKPMIRPMVSVKPMPLPLSKQLSKPKYVSKQELLSFSEIIKIFIQNGVEIYPFNLITLYFVMSHFE